MKSGVLRTLCVSTAVAATAFGIGAGQAGAAPVPHSAPIPRSAQAYDEVPTSSDVCAPSVSGTAGSVTNASALTCRGSGDATLTLASGGTAPEITLDFGQDVGGIPYFDVASETGSPTLQAGYSEGSQYVSTSGDEGVPWAEGDPARHDDYTVTAPGTITNTYIQGGERYEEITLTSPGTVSLSAAGIKYVADSTQADQLPGWFDSSDHELNRIWWDSEYTDQLDSVPAQSLPGAWDINNGVLDASGAGSGTAVGLLDTGSSWTNYTASFQAQAVKNQIGWFVRGSDPGDGYLFILNDSSDTTGTPNELQEVNVVGGAYNVLGDVPLPSSLTSGIWHTVSTTVSGSNLTVSLDGQQIASLTDSTHASGTFGFREFTGEEADFRDLSITDPDGNTLYSSGLSDQAALNAFDVPGVNQLPSIVDGAKRDRAVWSGDLNVEIPNIFYSTDNPGYATGSLTLLSSYQQSDGYMDGAIPPQAALSGANEGNPSVNYSADYSTYYVLDLADYYLYSGDLSYVQQQFSSVKNELAWDASQVDANGLLSTNSGDNADWDFYDPGKNGEVTEYNLLYYKALLDGATLANAVGDSTDASLYSTQATALKDAINANLYNGQTGLYDLSNADTTTVAQDANSLAVLYGVAPASDDATILATLKTDLWTSPYGPLPFTGSTYTNDVSPYISGYELEASLATGDTADAEQLLDTVWGHMISPSGPDYTGTMWENVSGSTGLPGLGSDTSLSHGWSTAPLAALSGYVLGVQPVTAGYATWSVQPEVGSLTYAAGAVPTPAGDIDVYWSTRDLANGFRMTVTSPAHTTGTVAVPTGGNRNLRVTVDGNVVWQAGAPSGHSADNNVTSDGNFVYVHDVPAGAHSFAMTPAKPRAFAPPETRADPGRARHSRGRVSGQR